MSTTTTTITKTVRHGYTLTSPGTVINLDTSHMLRRVTKARVKALRYRNTSATEDVMTILIEGLNQNYYSDGSNIYDIFSCIHLPAQNSTVHYSGISEVWDREGPPISMNQLKITVFLDHTVSASIDASNPLYLWLEFEYQADS